MHRRQKIQLDPKEIRNIQDEFNKKVEVLLRLAKYFGNAKLAAKLNIAELDQADVEKNVDYGLQQKEVRIQFSKVASNISEVKSQINLLDIEASDALSMRVDKSYIPPGRTSLKLFEQPSGLEWTLVVIFWSSILVLVFAPLPFGLRALLNEYMTQGDLFNVLFALVTINVGLTFATFGVGIYAEFPFDILMGWCGLTLIFGLMCVAPMVVQELLIL
ncbi:hypothetical protein HDV02_005608 [Globomyces sp. JEL0801]|nr:hypothetical protein HDV02_005608 [Globomyces sp. JEL0801]